MSLAFPTLHHALFRPTIIRDRKEGKARFEQLSLNLGLLLTLLFVSVFYLVQVNSLVTKGYAIKSLQKHIVEQQRTVERLQLKSIEQGSLGLIKEKSAALNLVKTAAVDYVGAASVVAALR